MLRHHTLTVIGNLNKHNSHIINLKNRKMENKHENSQILQEEVKEDATMAKGTGGAVIFFLLSAVFMGIGFYKLWAYDDSAYSPVNTYVGGDAYNYIINSNLATAYFTVAILFTLIALGYLIIGAIRNKK
jgi:hypothetical protein